MGTKISLAYYIENVGIVFMHDSIQEEVLLCWKILTEQILSI